MTELIIEPTAKTPQIDLNQFTGDLIFSGKSIPENAAKVYEPVLSWVKEYSHKANSTTNLRLNLEYYNTATTIWLTKIIKALLRINDPDFTLFIHLYLPIEDFDDLKDFDDIKDAFIPLSNIDYNQIPSIGIKIYGVDPQGEILKDTVVYIETDLARDVRYA